MHWEGAWGLLKEFLKGRLRHTKVGIRRALWDFKLSDAFWPEGLLSIVCGGGGAALIVSATRTCERVATMGDVLALAGAFLAVVFTALAIVVSLRLTSYLRMLDETVGGGMRRFLDPFLVAVGTQIAVVLLAVAYRLAAGHATWWVEHVAFYVIGFLFVFGVLDIAALARSLVRHGVLRARSGGASEQEPDGEARVRRLPDRR